MGDWNPTHGLVPGAYRRVDNRELYVRQAGNREAVPAAAWLCYVDGQLVATATGEGVARASAEVFLRGDALEAQGPGAVAAA